MFLFTAPTSSESQDFHNRPNMTFADTAHKLLNADYEGVFPQRCQTVKNNEMSIDIRSNEHGFYQ